jgi:hypothetical protein
MTININYRLAQWILSLDVRKARRVACAAESMESAAEEAVAAGDDLAGVAAAKGVFAVVIFTVVNILGVSILIDNALFST